MNHSHIRETDLHAYIDGQLDPARRAVVEAYLAEHSDAATYVQDLREQMQVLHRTYDGILNEPIPLKLTEALQTRWIPHGLAAGLVWMTCGVAAGWFAHMLVPTGSSSINAFAHDALGAHVLYVVEKKHPVEVPAEQQAHLVAWLSKRLDAPIHAPDLQSQGFSLLGGRLLPGDEGPLAQLMYESTDGVRLTLMVKHAAKQQADTGFKILQQNGTSVFYWIDRDYGYALSGAIDKARLLTVAQLIDAQLAHQ
ncbi:MAG TPA: anti-sigma factor [Burkholderiaceae bacterium]|jgi:anti-sigma factor RsiW